MGNVVTVGAGCNVEVLLPEDFVKVPIGATVYCASSQAVKRSYPYETPAQGRYRQRRPIRVEATLTPTNLRLRAVVLDDESITAEVSLANTFGLARKPEQSHDAFKRGIERLGDTEWTPGEFELSNPDHLFVPASVVNELRRQLAVVLSTRAREGEETRIETTIRNVLRTMPAHVTRTMPASVTKVEDLKWSISVRDVEMLSAFDEMSLQAATEVVLPVRAVKEQGLSPVVLGVERERVRFALPLIVRGSEDRSLISTISSLYADGWVQWEVASLAGVQILCQATGREPGLLNLTGDWSLYVLNGQAAKQCEAMGIRRLVLSPEDDEENIGELIGLLAERAVVPVFQYTPLFISETQPLMPGAARLSSRYGDRYAVLKDGKRITLVSEKPFSLSGRLARLRDRGAQWFRADFSHVPPPRRGSIGAIWKQLQDDVVIADSHVGNFERGMA